MAGLFEHGYALLIAVNENKVAGWALPDVAKDVAALEQVLKHPERCAYPEKNIKVVTGEKSTRQGILDGLEWLGECLQKDSSGNATAVIYYTGHGTRDESVQPNVYYLVPYDVGEKTFRSSALRAEDFAATIAELDPKRLLVVLDCCHAGGMQVKDLPVSKVGPSFVSIPPQVMMGAEKSISSGSGAKGLEALAQGVGRAVLSASQGMQSSYIRKDQTMSIFTYHLIEALTGHAQPQEGAKDVLVSDVMSYVYRRVPQSAAQDWQESQQPDYQVSGNFPVAMLLGGKGLSKGQPAPDPLQIAAPAPAGVQTSVQVGDISNVSGGEINVAGRDVVHRDERRYNTGGGAFIGGSVNVGGDFVGRDKVVRGDQIDVGSITGGTSAIGRGASAAVSSGLSPQEVERLFQPVLDTVRQAPADKLLQAVQTTDDLKKEVAKGKQADDSLVAQLIEGLAGLVPAAVSSLVTAFGSPILAGIAGPVTRYVLKKIQR